MDSTWICSYSFKCWSHTRVISGLCKDHFQLSSIFTVARAFNLVWGTCQWNIYFIRPCQGHFWTKFGAMCNLSLLPIQLSTAINFSCLNHVALAIWVFSQYTPSLVHFQGHQNYNFEFHLFLLGSLFAYFTPFLLWLMF